MDGILLIKKEKGMTSHDVVFQLRKILKTSKIGHTGTLDPNATGVLVVLVGKACKLIPFLNDTDKEYIAKLKLGVKTDTLDQWGTILETRTIIPIDNFEIILKHFLGRQQQLPPMVSAIKVNGKKLYEYARQGITVERPLRDIEIYDIEGIQEDPYEFRVSCSRGTYVRSLCEDIANKTGNLGCLAELERTRVGRFVLADCVTLEDVKLGNYQMHASTLLLDHYPKIEYLKIEDVYQGKKISLDTDDPEVVITNKDEVIAIYQHVQDHIYRCVRGLW